MSPGTPKKPHKSSAVPYNPLVTLGKLVAHVHEKYVKNISPFGTSAEVSLSELRKEIPHAKDIIADEKLSNRIAGFITITKNGNPDETKLKFNGEVWGATASYYLFIEGLNEKLVERYGR